MHAVDVFSQGSAILDAKDPDAVRDLVRATYASFERDFVRPAWERRQALIDRVERGEASREDLPHDILTILLLHRGDRAARARRRRTGRARGRDLPPGWHAHERADPGQRHRPDLHVERGPHRRHARSLADDLGFAQRVVHETLRLRPTTPKIKRRAEADTTVAGRPIPKDALVVLDAATANRDPRFFGESADRFDPDRTVVGGRAAVGTLVRGRGTSMPGSIGGGRVPRAGRARILATSTSSVSSP